MLVVIANDLPPAVRGRMKLWFIEPKPNVFISGVKDNVARKVVAYLYKHCPADSGVMVFRRIPETPGYDISGIGDTKRNLTEISGLQLVIEKQNSLCDS
ncbi:type I-E CRISPR-associated endoribonuclease Cas2 [Undibacterium jejuense]|uniref:Type I-E CRISPR-associated endoribonuclease Cas2 n=1 Tax=Undibacterium jejuense TaxID=1344949 RepID=A0A923HFX0_9BURK|nr:type I-E CRISPR-associated endoribonuclease Cas2e [Undibacterium jejuense]MBC3860882.1 type I-E CRISPR-associated endoribonuclease Cas2 [Undibacterium jejuense]